MRHQSVHDVYGAGALGRRVVVEQQTSAITFEKGHRIAVHIASSNYPRFEINPNTGEAPGERTMEPRAARNVIHHDAAHPTALLLPVR